MYIGYKRKHNRSQEGSICVSVFTQGSVRVGEKEAKSIMNLPYVLQQQWGQSVACHTVRELAKSHMPLFFHQFLFIMKEFLEDRCVAIVGRRDGMIFALSCDLSTILGSFTLHSCGGVWCLAIDEENGRVAFGSGSGRVTILDLWLNTEVIINLPIRSWYVLCLQFIFAGAFLLAGSEERLLWLIRVAQGSILWCCDLQYGNISAMVALRPGSNYVNFACGTESGYLCMCKVRKGGKMVCGGVEVDHDLSLVSVKPREISAGIMCVA